MTLKYFKNLAYEEMGEENEEIILFLHDKLLDKWIWKKQKEDHGIYFKNYHCIFLDLPNHGNSKSLEEFSINESSIRIIEFVEHLIDHKKIDKVNVVAIGLGGQIAIEIMSKKPRLIDSIIISGIEIADFKEENSVINRLAKTQAEYLNEKPDTFIVKAYLRYFGISKKHFNDMAKVLEISIKDEREIAIESLNYTIPKDLVNDKEILKKDNILIIFGNKEDLNCTKSAIELKGTFKNAKLVEIDKGNHLWNLIDSELFNTIISDFIISNEIRPNSKVRILE